MEIEDKLVIAKLLDKINLCKTRNKIVNTEFFTIYQRDIIQKELNKNKIKNYIFFGGYDDAESQILVLYPDKLDKDIVKNNLKDILKAIKIVMPKELVGKYNHRDYLGCVMKTGLNRNRIGDIIVHENGAYIIVLKENAEYIKYFLKELTRFAKAEVEVIDYTDIETKEAEFDEIKITSSSMRLDNIVSEIINFSRSKTEEMLQTEKMFVNSHVETKGSKLIKTGDIIAIRRKGKYIVSDILGTNKKGKSIILIKKYK